MIVERFWPNGTEFRLASTDEPHYWLYIGLSHSLTCVYQHNGSAVFRPTETSCGIELRNYSSVADYDLYVCVPVSTTCLWCLAGVERI